MKNLFVILFAFLLVFFNINTTLADPIAGSGVAGPTAGSGVAGPTAGSGVAGPTAGSGQGITTTYTSEAVKSQYTKEQFNPLPNITSLPQYASTIINALLGVIGSIALIMFTYSGFRWMTAAGDPKAVQTSRDTMLWAGLGLVMIFSSYALVKFVIDAAGG